MESRFDGSSFDVVRCLLADDGLRSLQRDGSSSQRNCRKTTGFFAVLGSGLGRSSLKAFRSGGGWNLYLNADGRDFVSFVACAELVSRVRGG